MYDNTSKEYYYSCELLYNRKFGPRDVFPSKQQLGQDVDKRQRKERYGTKGNTKPNNTS